jgi:hypothetical protein
MAAAGLLVCGGFHSFSSRCIASWENSIAGVAFLPSKR